MRAIALREYLAARRREAAEKRIPLRVMCELTYRCNFSCGHCYVPRSYRSIKEVPLSRMRALLDELADAGALMLGFTGGEPLLRPGFFPLLAYASRRGFTVQVYTNASLIDAPCADRLAAAGVQRVDITIPSLRERPFDRITGTRGAFARVMRAVSLLRTRRVPMGFKCCVLRENARERAQIARFAREHGAECRFDDMLQPRLDGDEGPFAYAAVATGSAGCGETGASGKVPRKVRAQEPVPSRVRFPCGAGRAQCAITPDGALKPCVLLEYPRIALGGTSFARAWRSMEEKLRRRIQRDGAGDCAGCRLRPYCTWCPARGWLFSRDLSACDPRSRQFAESVRSGER